MKRFFIGIDFSKKTFDATLIDTQRPDNVHGKFDNNRRGFRTFMKWVRGGMKEAGGEQALFCGENTGVYSTALSDWLYSKGLDVWIENAYTMKLCMGLVRGKNDKADSMRIAEYAMRRQDKARLYKPDTREMKELRILLMYKRQYTATRVKLSSMSRELREAGIAKGDEIISGIRRGNDKVCAILSEIEKEITVCMDTIMRQDAEMKDTGRILTSMKGISTMNAAAMIVYTGNFTKFRTANAMACYWGVAPFSRQSGTSVHTAAHVSPMCNRQLKALLTSAAINAVRFDPGIRAYYLRLVGRGKDRMLALNNVKAKMIKILFNMVKNGREYDTNYATRGFKDIEEKGDGRIVC